MKITKQQLRQVIIEEVKTILNPDGMEEGNPIPHPAPVGEAAGDGRTVMDDVAPHMDELAAMGITVKPFRDGVSLYTDRNKIANIRYVGQGENRYAVSWMPASNMALRNLLGLPKVEHYGTIEQILSGRVRTTGGDEIHIGPPTLSEE